jgi:hypothetical protein
MTAFNLNQESFEARSRRSHFTDMGMVGKLGLGIFLSAVGCMCSEVLRLSNEAFHAHLEANPLALVACM